MVATGGEMHEPQVAATAAHAHVLRHQQPESGAVDVGDVAQVEDELHAVIPQQAVDHSGERLGIFEHQPAAQREDRDVAGGVISDGQHRASQSRCFTRTTSFRFSL